MILNLVTLTEASFKNAADDACFVYFSENVGMDISCESFALQE